MAPNNGIFLRQLKENKKIIFKICNFYCTDKNDKDDLAQEIVFNLWKAFANYVPNAKFSTWMYRIALNVAISYYRKEIRSIQFSPYSENLIVFEDEDNSRHETDSNIDLLQKLIHELNEIDKSIIVLYLDDKSYREISEITGVSETNVATKISRIKDKLKQRFKNR